MLRGSNARPETEQVEFFERCHVRFLHARDSAGELRHYFRVGGRTVCLAFAGTSLVPHLTPALEHLRIPPTDQPADLTVCVWDSRSTATPMIPLPCLRENLTERGEIWGFNSHRIKTAFHWDEGSVNLLDHASRTGIYWVPHAEALPYWVRSAPLRTLFHWWMERNGCQLLHAAAIGVDGRGVLLTGKGGVGKSTTALACLRSGLPYLADDYLVVRLEPEPLAYSLYCTAKLNADHLANFPELRPLVRNDGRLDREKAVICLYPAFEHQIARAMPLRAILAPRIAGGDATTLRPAPTWDIQRAISFETMSQLPHVGGHTHDTLCRLASSIPGYTLEMGRDLDEIPAAISNFLAEGSRQPGPRVPANAARAAETPLVSVIIPVFNGHRFIPNAVDNILSQNYPALELIVVDGGSTDRTGEVVARLPYEVRCFKQSDAGHASARNRGVREASGEIIAFLDVDDLWPDNNLTSLVGELVRAPELDVVHGSPQLMAGDPRRDQDQRPGSSEEAFQCSISAALYRRSVFARVGLFDTTLIFNEDFDWFRRARQSGVKIRRIDSVTLVTRGGGLNRLRAFKAALDRKRTIEARSGGSG